MRRRTFLKTTALGAASLSASAKSVARPRNTPAISSVHIFSKHLQFLDYAKMAEQAAALGFDGVDLTVRPRGHVEPQNALRDLPRAIAAIRAAGLQPLMCTTGFTAPTDPHFDTTLDAIAASDITHLRMGYFRTNAAMHPATQLDQIRSTLPTLVAALEKRGLTGSLQNHAGAGHLGSSLWEYWQLLRETDPQVLGIQFDIRHATAERGASWEQDLAVAAPLISTLVTKDFKWSKPPAATRPEIIDTPLGEGWVDFPRYLQLLNTHRIQAPTSMHCEYDLGGAEHGHREITRPPEFIYAAMARDLRYLRQLISKSSIHTE